MNLLSVDDKNTLRLERGQALFKEGDTVSSIYLLKRGHIACITRNDERVIPIFCVKDQGIIGEDCIFSDDSKFFYSAVALDVCELVKLSKKDILSYINSSSDWVKNIFTDMSEKIEHTTEVICEHRIISDKLNGGLLFTDAEEVLIKKALN